MSVALAQKFTTPIERTENFGLFSVALTAFALSLLVYAYFVNAAVFAAAERLDLKKETANTTERVAILEFEYNTVRAMITPNQAKEKGFAAPLSIHYAEREKLTQNITF